MTKNCPPHPPSPLQPQTHQRVARLHVLEEQPPHARRQRPKVPPLQQHGQRQGAAAPYQQEYGPAQLRKLGAAQGQAALLAQDLAELQNLEPEKECWLECER